MGARGNDPYFRFHPPYAQRKYHNISCFWEKQPRGCLRISCTFHHSKPQYINGLFLPPTNNAPLQQAAHQGILHPGPHQQPHRNQHNTRLPIHPPLIINLQDDEDDEEEEENYVPDWVPKTAEEIEEERAIKEICYKSGEYYRIQPPREHPSTTTVSSPWEKELSPVEATHPDLQKGKLPPFSKALPSVLPIFSIATVFPEGSPSLSALFSVVGIVLPSPGKARERRVYLLAETRRKSSFDSAGPPLSAYIVSRAFTAKTAPKFSEATAVPEAHGLKGPEQKNQLHTKTRPGSQAQNYGNTYIAKTMCKSTEKETASFHTGKRSSEDFNLQEQGN
ncbi:uncharacterized protein C12orf50 homolog [Athene cunicularia]|uniref:uncharacterized protein C12orf50 homolog n=1 Tax=Athene cunicularia TaxID=194338 RepID=UPI000EF71E62|nr:uncharacterized protein C12orf50 homolog [Athene cunicularia]